jgi:F-box interacting protein
MLPNPHLTHPFLSGRVVLGFAYHSQNSDYKILRILIFYNKRAEAEVYTLSTDSWRKVQFELNIGSIVEIVESYCFFFNGALHSIASSQDYKFILSFDLNDERFREIMLPPNYLDGARRHSQSLAVFKGSLALIVLGENLVGDRDICHIWVMREYGVVESWTKQSVLVDGFERFFCCTDSGELLIHTFQRGFVSYDPESLNWNKLLILRPPWLSYTADLMESLVLLDQVKCN